MARTAFGLAITAPLPKSTTLTLPATQFGAESNSYFARNPDKPER